MTIIGLTCSECQSTLARYDLNHRDAEDAEIQVDLCVLCVSVVQRSPLIPYDVVVDEESWPMLLLSLASSASTA